MPLLPDIHTAVKFARLFRYEVLYPVIQQPSNPIVPHWAVPALVLAAFVFCPSQFPRGPTRAEDSTFQLFAALSLSISQHQ